MYDKIMCGPRKANNLFFSIPIPQYFYVSPYRPVLREYSSFGDAVSYRDVPITRTILYHSKTKFTEAKVLKPIRSRIKKLDKKF